MALVKIRVRESDAAVTVNLEQGDVVLVGRNPDTSRVARPLLPRADQEIRAVSVPSRLVSENHLLLWQEGDIVHCVDMQSRNGTRVELPASVPVMVPSIGALIIDLVPPNRKPEEPRPKDIFWSSEDDFRKAVAKELSGWLKRYGVNAVAELQVRSEPGAKSLIPSIPLGTGWEIAFVEEAGTHSAKWPSALPIIWEYIHVQMARLRHSAEHQHEGKFILSSPASQEVHRKIVEAAERGLRVILLGETGVGKSALARCFSLHSRRKEMPFEWVNCAHIDKQFAHTKLFGARKGAYTSCDSDIKGAVESADRGVLFLDEIGSLPEDVQAEFLTFLDDQQYKRLGDSVVRRSDVWIVCGANTDLRRAVREGTFREDLWYRLAGRVIEVPPLRERREDVRAFLMRRVLGEQKNALVAYDALSAGARSLIIERYEWPGNFRELESFVRRLPVTSVPESLGVEICEEALREGMIERRIAVSGWLSLIDTTLDMYKRIRGGDEPRTAEDFTAYVEDILKPAFFASRLGLQGIDAVPANPKQSYSKMGQLMGCSGETVKAQIENYVRAMKDSARRAPRA